MVLDDFPSKFYGELTYGKIYKTTAGEKLQFTFEIRWNNNYFSGIAKDVSGRGLSPDEANIEGQLLGDSITFTKRYKRRHFVKPDHSTEFQDKLGFPILYKAKFNSDKKIFEGTWKIIQEFKILPFLKFQQTRGEGTFWIKATD
jgi:hypothetical protein